MGTKIASLGKSLDAQHHAAALILGTIAIGGVIILIFGAILTRQANFGRCFPIIKASLVAGGARSKYVVVVFLLLLVIAVLMGLLLQALGLVARYGGMFSDEALKNAGFSGFVGMFSDNRIRSGMAQSVIVALGAAITSGVAGSASAIRLFLRQKALPVWLYLLLVPLILPQALLGHAFALFNEHHLLPDSGVARGILLILVHAGMFVAVTVFIVHVALSQYGDRYTEALVAGGENLGLSKYIIARETWRTWLPAALAGAMAVACLSLNEVVAAQHLLGIDTLAVVLESRHQSGMGHVDFASCVVLLLATGMLMVAAWALLRKLGRD